MSSIHDCAKAGDSAAVLRQLENGGGELADQARLGHIERKRKRRNRWIASGLIARGNRRR